MAKIYSVDETGVLLKDPFDGYICFKGSKESLKRYMDWYKQSNHGCTLEVIDPNLFIAFEEDESETPTVKIGTAYSGGAGQPVYWLIDGKWVHKGWLMPSIG